jgi:hypothetical protein
VWEDAEGNELEPEEVPTRKASSAQSQASRGGGRVVQAPSWNRTLKRGAIFAPIMLGVVMLLSSDLPFASQVFQAALIVAIFIPFSYFLDTIFWRQYKKREERQGGTERAPGQRKR